MDIRFGEHASFHRAAIGMTAGSAILGIALHPVTPLAPLLGGIFGIAGGAAFGYGKPWLRLIAAALACLPLFLLAPSWPALALCAATLALGTTISSSGLKGGMSVMFGATVMLLAMWTALRFDHANVAIHWPAMVTGGVASAAMGIVGVVAMLPRHLGVAFDPVAGAVKQLPPSLDSEVRALCTRTVAIWNDIQHKLGETDSGKDLVREAVLKTLEVATKSSEAQPPLVSDEELGRRMEDLDARIAAATDDEVRTQYQAARVGLSDQRKYRDRIRQNRERLVARMHNHLAALEKFQLVVGHHGSVSASQQLQELSQDVAASGEALVEVAEA